MKDPANPAEYTATVFHVSKHIKFVPLSKRRKYVLGTVWRETLAGEKFGESQPKLQLAK